jgi:hypothetical protein
MSRYDKYDPYSGGFRAVLAADFGYTAGKPDRAHADLGKLFAVGVSTSGLLGKFDSVTTFTNFVGVMILTSPKAAGDTVDVITSGEITELVDAEIKTADTLAAGQNLYADTTAASAGKLTTTATAMRKVGFTLELNATSGKARLVVRVQTSGTGA